MADNPRIEELKRRVQMDPASIAFAALAEEYRRAERYEEAIETCTAGLVRHPSYLSAHVTLGRALIEIGRLQEAQRELELVLTLAPENLAAIRGLAEIHRRLGDDHDDGHHRVQAAQQEPAPPAPVVAPAALIPFAVPGAYAAPPIAPQPLHLENGALAGLEQLLGAIHRARAASVSSR
jgi:tetratricopeptide (TPR) repeat protein